MATHMSGAEAFGRVDRDGSGEVDLQELQEIFERQNVFLTEEELAQVMLEIDEDGSGDIDLEEFLEWLRSESVLAARLRNHLHVGENTIGEVVHDVGKDPIAFSKAKLRVLGVMNGEFSIEALFAHYDRDGDGDLDYYEFKTALRRDAQVPPRALPEAELRALFDAIDTDGDKSVSVEEFRAWMDESISGDVLAGESADKPVTDAAPDMTGTGLDAAEEGHEAGRSGAFANTMHGVVTSTPFVATFAALIICNTVILAADHHPMDPSVAEAFEVANIVFALVFLCELLCKLVGFGACEYWKDQFNVFDTVVVLVGLMLPPRD
jgi:Ca2+-binding EF-hand superfamily protein